MRRPRLLVFFLMLTISAPLTAAEISDDYEMLLLPIVTTREGAHGTRWSTKPWMYVGPDARSIRLGPFPPRLFPPPPVPPGYYEILPIWLERPGTHNPGVLLYVHKEDFARLNLNVRLYSHDIPVANLPIVRMADYRRGTTRLFPLEGSSGKRINVRLYGKPGTTAEFRIGVVRNSNTHSFENYVLRFVVDDEVDEFEGMIVPIRPSYAELALPPLESAGMGGMPRVEITPVDETVEYWAMVTLTDNVTQAVEMVTPSP